MKIVDGINLFLAANVLLVAAALLLAAADRASARLRRPLSRRHLLRIGYTLAVAPVLLPWLSASLDNPRVAAAPVQLWAGDTVRAAPVLAARQGHSDVSSAAAGPSIPAVPALQVGVVLVIGGFVLWLRRLGRDACRTWRLVARATRLRRTGGVELCVSGEIGVPFSFWSPGRYVIVLPVPLLDQPRHARLALRHEAQHHRQGDTRVIYLIRLLAAAFTWNPAAHLLARQLLALQERACDEAILDRHRGVATGYCECLMWVAGSAVQRRELLQIGMSSGSRRVLLARLRAVLAPPAQTLGMSAAAALAAAAVSALLLLSAGIARPIADQRVSLAEAERMLSAAHDRGSIRAVLNEAVLHELNTLMGTRGGRAFVEASLQRMPSVAEAIVQRLDRDALPRELLAIPFVESGYVNRQPGPEPRHGAGLWMFIEGTARRYGLSVGPDGDERLQVTATTDAAARYLADLHDHFGDWPLALLAYNVGARQLDAAIDASGSRNAWTLAERLYAGQTNYLARVMATMLILSDARRLG